VAQYASWRWIFLINLPVGAASIGLLVRYLHEDVTRPRHRIDVAGAAIYLVAVGSFLFAPDPAPVWQPVVETFVLGAGLGLLSVASIVGPQSTVGWGSAAS
jgi:hypothetical protein